MDSSPSCLSMIARLSTHFRDGQEDCPGYRFGVFRAGARRPLRFRNSASCTCRLLDLVDGVFFFETTFDGRQYWDRLSPLCPHGFPVALSTHFSFAHRRSEAPFLDFLTCPLLLRHLLTAWLARADGQTLYCRLIFFVQASSGMDYFAIFETGFFDHSLQEWYRALFGGPGLSHP